MEALRDLLINLLAAFIGFLVGWLRGASSRWLRHRAARRFWKDVVRAGPTVVVGVHVDDYVRRWEPSGLLGVGDARALAEVQVQLDQIGVRSPKVLYSHQVEADARRGDLVLIGGPDCNELTAEVMARLEGTLRFVDPERHAVGIVDSRRGESYHPKMAGDPASPQGLRLVEDYGLVIRTPSPFNPDSTVLIVCGSFGYGSWAGAQLIRTRSFLEHRLVTARVPIECLFRTEVIDHTPQAPELLRVRSLDEPARSG